MSSATAAAAVAAATAAVSDEQVLKAVQALKKYVARKSATAAAESLFDDDPFIYVQLAMATMPAKSSPKPKPIPLPHPLYDITESEICLIVKDHDGQGHKDAKKKIKEIEPDCGINKVIGVSKLRKEYRVFEQRRQLAESYDLFLADERILPSLPRLLGKTFFQKKKQPIPIRLMKRTKSTTKAAKNKSTAMAAPKKTDDTSKYCCWRSQVKDALDATYFFMPQGTTIVVRSSRVSFSDDASVSNIRSVLNGLVCAIPRKWGNVKAVYIKTVDSVALPIYQAVPDEGERKIKIK